MTTRNNKASLGVFWLYNSFTKGFAAVYRSIAN